ncbi:hypothetical protein CYMTET_19028 [Cymbomonas tetramitiformis]|uniref:Uncharacterized protein n=1 Tax=Cymbomonas tetramitiformis TaxID=36881 RepID=A0AAE0L5Q8_9CHLO|nr:hypothetical protein CYMTET_39001 [Cymbomonas tetramitiformis]KAK3251667.1 hypothetical protein CYMTET_38996 [Cymbomonas tetramitiformis]KAK3272690.1 hypothetical protein CYMTET_19028 [Cymbomonas tetramitiformis]
MGSYLTALKPEAARRAYRCFAQAVRSVFVLSRAMLNRLPSFEFVFCEMSYEHPLVEELKFANIPHVLVKIENLMNISSDENATEFVVNAWDSNSFIGNGGRHDLTIDGYIVANAGERNDAFINDSYLHNHFFATDIDFQRLLIPVPDHVCEYVYISHAGERWYISLTKAASARVAGRKRNSISVENPFCPGTAIELCNETDEYQEWRSQHTAERSDRARDLTKSQYMLLWFLISTGNSTVTSVKDENGKKWNATVLKILR